MPKPEARIAEPDPTTLGFEDAFRALDDVVAQLEGDGLDLEASLALYAHGVELAGRCAALLDAAELRLREVDGGEIDAAALRGG